MESRIEEVLAEYERRIGEERELIRGLSNEEFGARRDEFVLPVGRSAGVLLNLLIKEAGARRIVELGTSYGYSTVWLAEAARETQGRVVSLEREAGKLDYARQMLRRAGLQDWVEFEVGDAVERIPRLDGPFDFVLIDLWKKLYVPCFELLHPRLAGGAIVVADNMLYPEITRDSAEAYRDLVRSKADMESILLPVGSGLEISRCTRDATLAGASD